ncbi:hypothetical protein [Subtercola sp. YIM 133946]|uniref:hypothetical protein n=1 Tax=Subtercola sp. YIM 133946 TaxID=3118909 RepID=UPI002F95D6F0
MQTIEAIAPVEIVEVDERSENAPACEFFKVGRGTCNEKPIWIVRHHCCGLTWLCCAKHMDVLLPSNETSVVYGCSRCLSTASSLRSMADVIPIGSAS